MATKPAFLAAWPWRRLGSFKYVLLGPWIAHSIYTWVTTKADEEERDLINFLILLFLVSRWVHTQIWMSLSRFQTARGKHKIVYKGIEFEQVDREENWDDHLLLQGLGMYLLNLYLPGPSNLPLWRTDGMILAFVLHVGPIEFLYYWFHRALHHHYLYSRYHSHHHSSIVTEPITSVVHPFAEILAYFALFHIPVIGMALTGTSSIFGMFFYLTFFDFMNNLGHCNFEFVPNWLFKLFPLLKYLMYTPSFHSLHHTQFRTNYSLFVPLYDYLFGTVDKSSDVLYEKSLKGNKEIPQVVYLTHPTSIDSIYHLRLGLPSTASKSYSSKWYLLIIKPLTFFFATLIWVCGSTFTLESIKLEKLRIETWVIPRFSFHYHFLKRRNSINNEIEKAIMEADREGVKVMSLGLHNQSEELNQNGKLYLQKHPNLKVRLVDGTALASAVVLNCIPQGTEKVIMRGQVSKACHAIALGLCKKGIKVATVRKSEHQQLKRQLPTELWSSLVLTDSNYDVKVWLVGNGITDKEQEKAPKGAYFIPFSQIPVKKLRKDCFYHTTPAMRVPKNLENMHACENELPRRVMSAWRVAGIIHAMEGWEAHECGDEVFEADKVWNAATRHGFLPLT